MALTYLAAVNRVRLEAGASGADLTSLGGTLSQENKRFKQWVSQAWLDIQTAHGQWKFMQSDFSFTTVIAQQSYTAATLSTPLPLFKNWKRDTFRAFTTSLGFPDEQILGFLDYPTFRNLYIYGNMRTVQGRPVLFSIDQDKDLVIGPLPDVGYTINGQYFRKASALSADADTAQTYAPAYDEDFDMLLVWKALESYAIFESAQEVLTRALREGTRLMSRLENDHLPEVTYGPPLA
mgnify:FL=1